MPEGKKNLIVNPFFTGTNSDTGTEKNYISTETNARPIPVPWKRESGGLRLEDINYPLMSSKRSQIQDQPDNTNVICLAGDGAAGGGPGKLTQTISLKRGGFLTCRFYSIRNPYGTCYTKQGTVFVSLQDQQTSFVDPGGPTVAAVNWEKREFKIDTPVNGPQDNYQLVFNSSPTDSVQPTCGDVIANMELRYSYAAQGLLKSPAEGTPISTTGKGKFPALSFLIREGNPVDNAPGTPLKRATVDFSITQNGSGTAFIVSGQPVFTYTAVCDDNGIVTIPAGDLLGGDKKGSEVLTLKVEDDVALTDVQLTTSSDAPNVPANTLQTLQALSLPVSMGTSSKYTEEPILFEAQFMGSDLHMQDLVGASVTAQILKNDQPITAPGNPYLKTDTGNPVFNVTAVTDQSGIATLPSLYSSVFEGTYQIRAFLTDSPTVSANIPVVVRGISSITPSMQQQEATWGVTVDNLWSVQTLDAAGKASGNQTVQFRIIAITSNATFTSTGTNEAVGISNTATGKITIPALTPAMTPGTFRLRISSVDGTVSAQIMVTVLQTQVPSKMEFLDPIPDLSAMAGRVLYSGIAIEIKDTNGQDMRSGRANFVLSGTSAGSVFYNPASTERIVDVNAGIAVMPPIIIGTTGTLTITATMDNSNVSVTQDFIIK